MLFSLFQTLCLWGLNPRTWLTAYLGSCASAGGKAPAELDRSLPWKMTEEQRQDWSLGPKQPTEDSS